MVRCLFLPCWSGIFPIVSTTLFVCATHFEVPLCKQTRSEMEVNKRIGMATDKFNKMKRIVTAGEIL